MIIKKSIPGTAATIRIFLIKEAADLSLLSLSEAESSYLQEKLSSEQRIIEVNRYSSKLLVIQASPLPDENHQLEAWRRLGNEVAQWGRKEKIKSAEVVSLLSCSEKLLAFVEGILLGSYQFLKYNSKAEKARTSLEEILILADELTEEQVQDFTPTPMTLATEIYYSGYHPYTLDPVV